MIRLVLPLPCPANRLYRSLPFVARNGYRGARQVLSKRARIIRDQIVAAIHKQLGGRLVPIKGHVQIAYLIVPATRRACDVDAYEKHLLDCLTHAGVWEDDAQVVAVNKERSPAPCRPGHLEVEIWEVNP